MSEFEFLSVLISIIIGLGLTHILTGSMRAIFGGRATENQLVYTAFVILVLVLNWWVIFSWRDHQNWSFDAFLVLIVWAISHFIVAITLYPPYGNDPVPFEANRRWFLWSFFAMTLLDIAQTFARGDLFEPWYYLAFVLHFSVLALVGIFFQSPVIHRLLSWWFLVVILTWSLGVRRFLL